MECDTTKNKGVQEMSNLDKNKEIRKKAIQIEKKINDSIQKLLNREDLVQQTAISSEIYGTVLNQLQQYMELLSIHFNLPTKNDIANTARLVIQVEEKIDRLEEQLLDLKDYIEEMKKNASELPKMNFIMEKKPKETVEIKDTSKRIILSRTLGKEKKVRRTEEGDSI